MEKIVKGKVMVKWDALELEGIEQKDIINYTQNVEIDYNLGAWFMLSLSNDMEVELAALQMRRGLWNIGLLFGLVLWSAWSVIALYDIKSKNHTQTEGLLLIVLSLALVGVYWIHWRRNTNIIRKSIKSLLAASICIDGFVFAKDGDLEDETIKGRAEAYFNALGLVNKSFIEGWFNIHYIIPKSFEVFKDYDKRLREIVFTVVRNTETTMIKSDESVFLSVNKRQVGQVENDLLIEIEEL